MMKITLKQLNRSYGHLQLLAAQELPAKVAYKIGRIIDGAESEQNRLNKAIGKVAKDLGFALGTQNQPPQMIETKAAVPEDIIEKFNDQADDLMTAEVELWGDPFKLSELASAKLTGAMCATLSWMIIEDDAAAEPPKAAAAAA